MGKKVKAASARKPVPAKIEKISKSKKPVSVVTKETIDKVLPSVETDAVLKEISVKSQAAERKEEKEEGAHEKVKVKRKDSLIKSTEKNAKKLKKDSVEKENTETIPADPELQDKSYLSLDNPAEDDKKIKVPSYSYKKNRGVVYISHIPHGFYEAQMREFFSQFGTITNLRLGRSKKTGKSRGFAFVEFKFDEVAKVVAETMNNYLMFNKILKCELLAKEKCKPNLFMGKINPNKPPQVLSRRSAKKLLNAPKTDAEDASRIKRQQKSVEKLKKTLAAAGIEYNVNIS